MSRHTSQAQTRISVDEGSPIVIDVEAALDDTYSALAHERRRAVLCVAARESMPLSLDSLAIEVATREQTAESGTPSTALTKRVRTSLYHNHLPKLADHNLIDYDPDAGRIEGVANSASSFTL